MNIEPRYYQLECANQVYELIIGGKRKVTILIPIGAGKTVISILIAEKVCGNSKRAIIVTDRVELTNSVNGMIEQFGAESIESMTYQKLIGEKTKADLYLLYSLRPSARQKIADYIREETEAVVVSLGEPHFEPELQCDYQVSIEGLGIEIDVEKTTGSIERLAEYYKRLGNVQPLVYSTESIIDIRDIMSATKSEKDSLAKKLRYDRNRLAHDMTQLTNVANSSSDSKLLEVIEKQNRKIKYYEQLLVSCGISQATLEEEFDKIESLREELKDNFFNEDGSVNETVMSQFETAVADSVVKTTKHVLTLENHDRYVDILKELMTEDVWDNKLSDSSKSYLITAKMNYESMLQMENKADLDFSGVCLLVTKALDVEISRRLYTAYIDYLNDKYLLPANIRRWPNSLLNKDRNGVLESKNFTLGSVMYVVGVDKDGNIKNNYCYGQFRQYAKDELYKRSISDSDREIKIKNMVNYVEKVRMDYRNPAAHRNSLDFITAEACMDYMLETYKKLKEILVDLRR